jgi:hypothetical protein
VGRLVARSVLQIQPRAQQEPTALEREKHENRRGTRHAADRSSQREGRVEQCGAVRCSAVHWTTDVRRRVLRTAAGLRNNAQFARQQEEHRKTTENASERDPGCAMSKGRSRRACEPHRVPFFSSTGRQGEIAERIRSQIHHAELALRPSLLKRSKPRGTNVSSRGSTRSAWSCLSRFKRSADRPTAPIIPAFGAIKAKASRRSVQKRRTLTSIGSLNGSLMVHSCVGKAGSAYCSSQAESLKEPKGSDPATV